MEHKTDDRVLFCCYHSSSYSEGSMARLLGIRIKNYKSFADLKLGKVEYSQVSRSWIPHVSLARNGSGKVDPSRCVRLCIRLSSRKALRLLATRLPVVASNAFRRKAQVSHYVSRSSLSTMIPIDRSSTSSTSFGRRGTGGHQGDTAQPPRRRDGGKPYYFLILNKGVGKVWIWRLRPISRG